MMGERSLKFISIHHSSLLLMSLHALILKRQGAWVSVCPHSVAITVSTVATWSQCPGRIPRVITCSIHLSSLRC